MAQVFQLILQGISVGAIYALVALGLVLGYKATETLNFAHGDLVMLGAFLGWWLVVPQAWPFWWALVAVVALVALLAYGLEVQLMRRVIGQPRHVAVLLTIGLGHMLRGATSMAFGPESRMLEAPWQARALRVGGAVVAEAHGVILSAALLVTLALAALLRWSAAGRAMLASAQNQLAARLCGAPVPRLNALAWGLSGAIAALCGMLLAPITLVDASLWLVLVKGFAALVLGGFGSMPGAIAGGLLLGLCEQFAGVYLPDGSRELLPYLLLIGVLVVFPHGLLGETHGRRL